jgi:hypothetical protein
LIGFYEGRRDIQVTNISQMKRNEMPNRNWIGSRSQASLERTVGQTRQDAQRTVLIALEVMDISGLTSVILAQFRRDCLPLEQT